MNSISFRSLNALKIVRLTHRGTGIGLSLFVLTLAFTGIVLVHQKEWGWFKHVEVPQALIPGWAVSGIAQKAAQVKTLVVAPLAGGPDLITATRMGLFARTGETWTSVKQTSDQPEITALLVAESRWFIGTQQGLFITDDAGGIWKRVGEADGAPMGKITTIQQSPLSPATIFVGSKSGAYISTDAGMQWSSLAEQSGESAGLKAEINTIAFDPAQPVHVFFSSKQGIYRYHTGSKVIETLDLAPLNALLTTTPAKMTLDVYLNDLHTGKLFAEHLWPLYDLTAIGLVLFVGTGLYIWISPKLRRRQLGFGRDSLPVTAPSLDSVSSQIPARVIER